MNPTACKSCGLPIFHGPAGYAGPQCMCRWTNAAPRQPEGEAISRERVQAEADAFFDWPTTDKSSVTTTSCLIFARCIAGMVAAERDAAIAELRGLTPELPPRPPEGEGMPRYGLRWNGPQQPVAVPMADGYWTPWHLAETECDTLRQQLAEARDEISQHSNDLALAYMKGGADIRQQRDKLAGLLREVRVIVAREVERWTRASEILPVTARVESGLLTRIDAALAEVKPCAESPHPAST